MLASSVCLHLSDETNDWNGDGQTLNMLLHQSGPHWKKLPETKFSFMGNGLYSYSIGIFSSSIFQRSSRMMTIKVKMNVESNHKSQLSLFQPNTSGSLKNDVLLLQ
jgi:hypothetical protein